MKCTTPNFVNETIDSIDLVFPTTPSFLFFGGNMFETTPSLLDECKFFEMIIYFQSNEIKYFFLVIAYKFVLPHLNIID